MKNHAAKKIAEQGHACHTDPDLGLTTCWNKAGKSIAEFDGTLESLKLEPALATKLAGNYRSYCATEVAAGATAKRNPFIDFGLAKPADAICLNIDGRIQFWKVGDVRVEVEFRHAVGNFRNESWTLRVESQTEKVLQVQNGPCCVALLTTARSQRRREVVRGPMNCGRFLCNATKRPCKSTLPGSRAHLPNRQSTLPQPFESR